MTSTNIKPKVTICVVTYNQDRYIGDCLQSLVDQKVDFPFEIVVSDDFSTDSTVAIINHFCKEYPNLVRANFHKKNIGAYANYLFAHQHVAGQYVAHIDGDDLAYPGKLQAQVDELDADPACTVVWHRMQVFDDTGSISAPNLPSTKIWPEGKVQLRDLLRFGSIVIHSSTMYRASARKTKLMDGQDRLDWFFAVEYLRSGHGKYLEAILGGYRLNANTGISRAKEGTVRMRRLYGQHLRHYLKLMPLYRQDIFINSTMNGIVDVINGRPSWRDFCSIALGNFSLSGLIQLPASLRRLRLMSAKAL